MFTPAILSTLALIFATQVAMHQRLSRRNIEASDEEDAITLARAMTSARKVAAQIRYEEEPTVLMLFDRDWGRKAQLAS